MRSRSAIRLTAGPYFFFRALFCLDPRPSISPACPLATRDELAGIFAINLDKLAYDVTSIVITAAARLRSRKRGAQDNDPVGTMI
jgi:hypothetical protein